MSAPRIASHTARYDAVMKYDARIRATGSAKHQCDRAPSEPHVCDCLGMCPCHKAAIEARGYVAPRATSGR